MFIAIYRVIQHQRFGNIITCTFKAERNVNHERCLVEKNLKRLVNFILFHATLGEWIYDYQKSTFVIFANISDVFI